MEVKTTDAVTRSERSPARVPSPNLATKMFQVAEGEITTADAPEGQLVAIVTDIQKADIAADKEAIDNSLTGLGRALEGDMLDLFMATLRGSYDVSVNEPIIQETVDSF